MRKISILKYHMEVVADRGDRRKITGCKPAAGYDVGKRTTGIREFTQSGRVGTYRARRNVDRPVIGNGECGKVTRLSSCKKSEVTARTLST